MISSNGYEITDSMGPEEYLQMRQAVGWSVFPVEQAAEGLAHTAYLCCIRKDGKPVGIGRAIWDHGYVVYRADVIVLPEYPGQGLGREIMELVMPEIRGYLKPGYRIMVSLMAAAGKEEFYRKFGFEDRPKGSFGCGMHQWMTGPEV